MMQSEFDIDPRVYLLAAVQSRVKPEVPKLVNRSTRSIRVTTRLASPVAAVRYAGLPAAAPNTSEQTAPTVARGDGLGRDQVATVWRGK